MTRTSIAIPAYCERDWLPVTLGHLAKQEDLDFEVWVCVNQAPDQYLDDPISVTQENEVTLDWLSDETSHLPYKLHVIDAVHEPGRPSGNLGAGWARRRLFEAIDGPDDPLVISMDADTYTPPQYVGAVKKAFQDYPNGIALAAPFLHPLPENNREAMHLLRYEIYMRYYQLSLWRIGNPYAYLPIGSAMAFRAEACRRIGGVPARKAGEDFYLLQQLRKTGPVIRGLSCYVEPAARPSRRVPFGTGPVIAADSMKILENRFPFYHQESFDELGETAARFKDLYESPCGTPMDDYFEERLGGERAFQKLRRNFKTRDQFVKACHERLDGLRILQFMRYRHQQHGQTLDDETQLNDLLRRIGKPEIKMYLDETQIVELDALRRLLFDYEREYQDAFMVAWDYKARW